MFVLTERVVKLLRCLSGIQWVWRYDSNDVVVLVGVGWIYIVTLGFPFNHLVVVRPSLRPVCHWTGFLTNKILIIITSRLLLVKPGKWGKCYVLNPNKK